MRTNRFWHGVRMRRAEAAPEPDAPLRQITLPAAWDDTAAAALAWLAPGEDAAEISAVAEAWIAVIEAKARLAGMESPGAALHELLARQRGAPGPGIWFGQADALPSFTFNLTGFLEPGGTFDTEGLIAGIELAVAILTLSAPGARRIAVSMADLAGLIAGLGLAYDSPAARALGAALAALLRGVADGASARMASLFGGVPAEDGQTSLAFGTIGATTALPPAPTLCPIPGLAAAAGEALASRPAGPCHHEATVAILPPGPVDALLGVETGGIAPAFSPLAAAGDLTRAARQYLAARGLSPEAALAATLAGACPFPAADSTAHLAMCDVIAPFCPALPALPRVLSAPRPTPRRAETGRRPLPARTSGHAQRASLGGHTVFLRTADYADGSLGEISVSLAKENAAFRGLLDCFATAVTIGLQHGVPLAEYVEAFTLTRFGAAGTVEGDPTVSRATSVLDYVFRNLAAHYLSRTDLPEAPVEEETAPQLPLDLPARPRPPKLRLVGR